MKTQKFTLEIEEDDEITLGLVRLIKEIPDYELFHHFNVLNPFKFKRIADLIFRGKYYDYHFPRFEAFHHDTKVCLHFISNQSSEVFKRKFQQNCLIVKGIRNICSNISPMLITLSKHRSHLLIFQ